MNARIQHPPKPGVRAVTHVHTLYSWDSRTSIERTVDALVEANVGLALITDHNSYEGSRACRAEAVRRGIELRVPTAAEVRTDRGDVIVVFDHDDPPPISELVVWDELPERVRHMGGLIWLPHPFQSHVDVEELAAAADVVEVFNARCSADQNRRAEELCSAVAATPGFGFDAHRAAELTRFSVIYPDHDSMLTQLRSEPYCSAPQPTRASDIAAAEVMYGIHRRSPKKVAYFGAKWTVATTKQAAPLRPTRRTGTAAAIVMGDIDLVTALDLADIAVISAGDTESVRFSRVPERRVPTGDGWSSPERVVDTVERIAATEAEPPVLVYGHDEDVLMLAEHGERLSRSVRFVSAEPSLARDLIDKSRFIELAQRCSLPVPSSASVTCRDSGPLTTDEVRFPVIVKPATREPARWTPAAGRAKAVRFDSPEELAERWDQFQAIDADLIVQEVLPGPERDIVSYHVYVDDRGSVVGDFAGRKIRTWPLQYGHSTAVEITDDPAVIALGRSLAERIQLTGVAKFDFKPDAAGKLRLLEINPRFSLWHHPAALAGVNIPALVHADLTGLPRPAIDFRPGVRWCNPATDALAARADGVSFIEWLRFLRGVPARHGLTARDPLAGLGLLTRAITKGADRARAVARG